MNGDALLRLILIVIIFIILILILNSILKKQPQPQPKPKQKKQIHKKTENLIPEGTEGDIMSLARWSEMRT